MHSSMNNIIPLNIRIVGLDVERVGAQYKIG